MMFLASSGRASVPPCSLGEPAEAFVFRGSAEQEEGTGQKASTEVRVARSGRSATGWGWDVVRTDLTSL